MRKVFLDDLPKGGDYGISSNQINWIKSIGCKVKFIYDNINGEIEIIDYKKNDQRLFIKYNNNIFKIKSSGFLKCCLGNILGKYTSNFKIQIGQSFKDNKRDITITNREYRINARKQKVKFYKYTCNKCGWTEGWIREGSLLNGQNCSCCTNQTTVEGINDIPTTASWMIKYFQGGYDEAKLYTKSSSKKIYPICPDCNRISNKQKSIYNIFYKKTISCYCGDGFSYPNKFAFNLLEQLNINFTPEYNPDWIKPRKYDFYFEFNNKKYILEMDGGWHKKDNKMSGQTAEKSKEIDNYKDKMARKYGIQIIRIDCEESDLEYIKNNILNSYLYNVFDLSNINWFKCEEFALNNLVSIVCEYKNKFPHKTTTDISKLMNLQRTTIIRYLKKGTELGWCNYDPQEEMAKQNATKDYAKIRKKIICINTLEIFDSIKKASEKHKIINSSLCDCCKGKQKSAGKHPITGEKLRWMYYDEYIKQQNKSA